MAQAIPFAIMAAGSLLNAGGTIIGANSEAKELRTQAAQLDAQAGTTRASSQRQAMEERRQARLVQSRQLALAAAGGGADDPSVVNAMADVEGEGSYRAAAALYDGDTQAQGYEAQAAANRRGAKSVKTAGALKAAGTILSAGTSLFGKYG
jgi:hypothetical protein